MVIGPNVISVCSWSLKCPDVASLVLAARQLGVEHLHLSLAMLVDQEGHLRQREADQLAASGMQFSAGMVGFRGENYGTIQAIRQTGGFVPDALWPQRQRWLRSCRAAAAHLRIGLLTTHIGFVPGSSEPGYAKMVERVQQVAGELQGEGMSLLMETGQEPASELLQFLNDVSRTNVGVNFDPANMLLYGAGDPIQAVHTLAAHIRHVHVKDAVPSSDPGVAWGNEVAFGQGQVQAGQFLASLAAEGYRGALAIEREGGKQRLEDVKAAIELIRNLQGCKA